MNDEWILIIDYLEIQMHQHCRMQDYVSAKQNYVK